MQKPPRPYVMQSGQYLSAQQLTGNGQYNGYQSTVYNSNTPGVTTVQYSHTNQPTIIQTPPSENNYEHFYGKLCSSLGISHIGIGALTCLMNIVICVREFHTYAFFMGHGFWGGLLFIITGSLGAAAGSVKNTCLITAYMTMCIICVSLPTPMLIMISAADVGLLGSELDSGYYAGYYYDYSYVRNAHIVRVGLSMEAIILILGVIQMFVGIISAGICCHAVCCCKRQGAVWPAVHYTNQPQQGTPSVIFLQSPSGLGGDTGIMYVQAASPSHASAGTSTFHRPPAYSTAPNHGSQAPYSTAPNHGSQASYSTDPNHGSQASYSTNPNHGSQAPYSNPDNGPLPEKA